MDKKAELKNIVKSCETRFNRGASDAWKHSDFSDFSREIQQETKVNISTNTLKRIFGKISVDDYYLPQQATIDALKNYSGYIPSEGDNNDIINTESIISSNPTILMRPRFLWSILIVLLVILGLYFFIKNEENNLGTIKVSNTEGLLPKTAFFDLQIPKSEDSIFMDFGDKSSFVYLEPEQTKISHVYLFPGVFKVNFKRADSILARTKVYVPSNKWIGLGFFRQRDIPNSYYAFPALKNGKDSLFHISNNQLQKAGLDTLKSFYTRLCNFTPINHHSDNFIFEATFKKVVQEKGIYCNSMQFQVSGFDNMIRFNFVSLGCSSSVLNVISEQSFHGTTTDLSRFVLDLNQWNTVKLINKNKDLSLFANGKLIFRGSYKQSIGDLRGVFVEFKGNGYVKKCSLKSLNGEELYDF
ncbi:MAG TPA: hypothetical protein VL859_12395 [Flavobacterium sp.]|nr:hypothetical protein [Flavobacterium sp.]